MKHGKADKQLSIPVACRSTKGKAAPGTHNRRARRARTAQQGLLGETEPDELRALWAAFGRHQGRRRASRPAELASHARGMRRGEGGNTTGVSAIPPPPGAGVSFCAGRVECN